MILNVPTIATPLGTMKSKEQTTIRPQLTNPAKYRKPEAIKTRGEFSMPMGFHVIQQFETMNEIIEPTMDHLLLFNKDVHHYVVINNLSKLVCTVNKKRCICQETNPKIGFMSEHKGSFSL